MTCDEFENAWMSRLDRRDGREPTADETVRHAASCPTCRAAEQRYLTLEHALGLIPPAPVPLPIETERLALAMERLAAAERKAARVRSWIGVGVVAAASVVAVGFAYRRFNPPSVEQEAARILARSSTELPSALEDARSATVELAWGASAPAARFGAAVLESAAEANSPEFPPVPVPIPTSSGVIGSVGRQVNEGVKPLRGSALKAFDFLIAPTGGEPAPASGPGRGA